MAVDEYRFQVRLNWERTRDYFILNGHDLLEPISEGNLLADLERGALTGEELARPENGFFWVPLRKLLATQTPRAATGPGTRRRALGHAVADRAASIRHR